MLQLERAVKIADIRYPHSEGWQVIWVFDHSSCHTAMAEDALDANCMDVKPGGKQPKIHDTVWAGKVGEEVGREAHPRGIPEAAPDARNRRHAVQPVANKGAPNGRHGSSHHGGAGPSHYGQKVSGGSSGREGQRGL